VNRRWRTLEEGKARAKDCASQEPFLAEAMAPLLVLLQWGSARASLLLQLALQSRLIACFWQMNIEGCWVPQGGV
jgi:hypothetical protein